MQVHLLLFNASCRLRTVPVDCQTKVVVSIFKTKDWRSSCQVFTLLSLPGKGPETD